MKFKCSPACSELLSALITLGELKEEVLQRRAWEDAFDTMGGKMRIGDTIRWECWDSRDIPQEVKIVGYSDKNGAWEIETKNGVRWFVGANAGTLFPLGEGRMNTELIGMSSEELIQWACRHGRIVEMQFRRIFPDIELFCAQNPMSVQNCVALLVYLSNDGVEAPDGFESLKKAFI